MSKEEEDKQLAKIKALRDADKEMMALLDKANVDGRYYTDPELVHRDLIRILEAHQPAINGKRDPAATFVPKTLAELKEVSEAIKLQERIPMGIPGINEVIGGGVLPGWITIVGAFSGNGKTTICIHEAVSFSARGHPVLFITAELSEPEVYNCIQAATSETPEFNGDIQIVYPECDVSAIVSGVERWLDTKDGNPYTPVVFVDYAQKLRASGKQFSREREVAVVAESIQFLARKYHIAVFAAAQLNRMSQTDEVPKIHHLRESGLLEQIADIVILSQKTESNRLTLFVGKNRWGRSDGQLDLTVDFPVYRFGGVSLAQKYHSFALEVVDLIKESGGSLAIRSICQSTRIDKKHPSKFQVVEAGIATGFYRLDGPKAIVDRSDTPRNTHLNMQSYLNSIESIGDEK